VLFVSTRNSTWCELAERLLRPALAADGVEAWAIRVTSAGLEDENGARIDPDTEDLLRSLGGNPGGFRSRLLDHDTVDDVDLIITMTRAERDLVLASFPRALRRVFSLVEYVRLNELVEPMAPLREHPAMLATARAGIALTDADDILSPAGRDPKAYDAARTAISANVHLLAETWIAMAPARARQRDPLGAATMLDQGADAEEVALDAFGVAVDVRCTGDGGRALARALRVAWARCARVDGRSADLTVEAIVHDGRTKVRVARARGAIGGETTSEVMHSLARAITVRAIDERAGEAIMLHAAGLAMPDGRVVAFVAPSGTGKTTLARTVGRTYGYVSDETVVIALDGRVTAYPKPLSVITSDGHRKQQLAPDDENLVRATGDLRLARIVLLQRDPTVGSMPRVDDVPLLAGIAELAAQVSYLPRLAEPLRSIARAIERTGGLQRVTYAEASDLAQLVPTLAGGAA